MQTNALHTLSRDTTEIYVYSYVQLINKDYQRVDDLFAKALIGNFVFKIKRNLAIVIDKFQDQIDISTLISGSIDRSKIYKYIVQR